MYIRRTRTHNSTTGEHYRTHRLVRSARVGGKVRQITLLNLGRHFAVPPAEWPTLCVRLEELLGGQGVLLEGVLSPAVEREAQRIGRLKETSHGVGQHYSITVEPDAGGVNAQAIR
ncbi:MULTISPECIES: hypothetical protein [unclassified Thiocapsa]|uniref:hypothetical protein n=1 Tax=unclassified Thiocapsa TaxID=2641286 RepID=UPI0035B14AF1